MSISFEIMDMRDTFEYSTLDDAIAALQKLKTSLLGQTQKVSAAYYGDSYNVNSSVTVDIVITQEMIDAAKIDISMEDYPYDGGSYISMSLRASRELTKEELAAKTLYEHKQAVAQLLAKRAQLEQLKKELGE